MFTFFLVRHCQPLDQGKQQEDHQAGHANSSEGRSSPLKTSRAGLVIPGNATIFHVNSLTSGQRKCGFTERSQCPSVSSLEWESTGWHPESLVLVLLSEGLSE